MDVEAFGNALLDTLDLDPVYVVVYNAGLDIPLKKRWLLAYWCFYHGGVASKIADAKDFYVEMNKAQDEKWPRGRERRHFRGQASSNAIRWLKLQFSNPESAVDYLMEADTFNGVRDRITHWPLFGPWIAYKAADMIERVMGKPVSFSTQDLNFYKEPAEAARLIDPGATLVQVVGRLIEKFKCHKAPPAMDRACGVQEIETCMCKFKSYKNGHYYVGQDIKELGHALKGWGPLADRVLSHLPQVT